MNVLTVPQQTYPIGTFTSNVTNVTDGTTSIQATLTRVSWPDIGSEVVQMSVDISLDGGTTWITPYFGWGAPGGIIKDRQGNTVTTSTASIALPTGTNRKLRATVQRFASITTAISVDIF